MCSNKNSKNDCKKTIKIKFLIGMFLYANLYHSADACIAVHNTEIYTNVFPKNTIVVNKTAKIIAD